MTSSSSARSGRMWPPSKRSRPYGSSSTTGMSYSRASSSSRRRRSGEQRHAGRVLEVRDRVDELRAARPELAQLVLERVHAHAAVVHRHAARCSGWYAENAWSAPTYVGPSAMTTSPGSRKTFASRSSPCCAPAVTMRSSGAQAHARLGHQRRRSARAGAQRPVASRRTAAPSRPVVLAAPRAWRAATASCGTRRDVGHAAGERDHVGARRRGEQVAHGRGAHARHPLGVAAVPLVEDHSAVPIALTRLLRSAVRRALPGKRQRRPTRYRARVVSRGTTCLRLAGHAARREASIPVR